MVNVDLHPSQCCQYEVILVSYLCSEKKKLLEMLDSNM